MHGRTQDDEWDERVIELWSNIDDYDEPESFHEAMQSLVDALPPGEPRGIYEKASAYDSTGFAEHAEPLYRAALTSGLAGSRRRQAVIQLASTLRNLGNAQESVALLTAERANYSDDLDDAVAAILALALVDAGREREACAVALSQLATHLTRYRRALTTYARELTEPST